MPTLITLHRPAILILCLVLAACTRGPDRVATQPQIVSPTPSYQTVHVEVPVTVEVTRVVTQPVIIEATPIPPAPCAQQRFDERGEITIGALLPLSGPRTTGTRLSPAFSMQSALNLAIDRLQTDAPLNATFRLVTYDTAGKPEQAAEFAQRLITLDCAAAIIGGFHSPVALATALKVEEFQIPYLVFHAAADEITAAQHTSVFRLAPAWSMYAAMPGSLLRRMAAHEGRERRDVLLIVEPSSISNTLSEQIVARLSAQGIDGEILAIDLPTQDFSPVIARILSRPHLPDAIFIYVYAESALALQAQLLKAGIGPERDVLIVNNHAAQDPPRFWREVAEGTGTIAAHIGPWPGDISPLGENFGQAYSDAAAEWPQAFVFAAYDAVLLVADAVARAESVQGPQLIAALAEADITLASGHYSFPYGPHHPPHEAQLPSHFWQQWLDAPLYFLRYTESNQDFAAMHVEWSTDDLWNAGLNWSQK